MRRTLAIICFLIGFSAAPLTILAQVSDAQDEFVNAFLSSRKGEEQEKAGDFKAALAAYRTAASLLTKIKQESPGWQPEMRDFRLAQTLKAIERVQARTGGPANDLGLPPLLPGDPLDPAPGSPVAPPARKPGKVTGPVSENPIEAITQRIANLETQLADANDRLREEQQKNAQLTQEMGEAMDARKKAEGERKKAQDLAEVYQKAMLELKAKGDASSERVKELEGKLADLKRKNLDTEVELASAEERIAQLISRSRVLVTKANEAATLPTQVKKLQAKLEEEQKTNTTQAEQARKREEDLKGQIATLTKERIETGKLPAELKDLQARLNAEQKTAAADAAKAQKREEDLKGQITSLTKERNDARTELARLKEMNTQTDKLINDNANLLKKLGEAEKQILTFKTDSSSREADIAALKKQVTDTQKALAASTEKSTTLQAELGELQKKVTDYSKQIAQFKVDKTVNAEERRKMEDENKLLQGIVMRVLQEDANRAQRKKMIQSEIGRLQIQSDALLQQVNYLTQPVVKLSSAERRLFKKPVFDVQDPNTLVAIKTDVPIGAEPPARAPETTPAKPNPGETAPTPLLSADPANASPSIEADPAPEAGAPRTGTKPIETAKLENLKPGVKPKPIDDLPAKEPTGTNALDTKPAEIGATPTVATMTGAKLPTEVKPLAEQAKQAFEREKFSDSENLYNKALQLAPNNVYLLSNRAVVQFRMGKFKQAEESFRKALSVAPEDAFCWSTIGIVYYSEEKYDEAVNALTKSLAINPKNPTAHNYLGITAAQKGWLEAAQKELETAIQLDPKYADAWFNLAVTHTLKQPPNKEEARKAYEKALEFGADKDPAMEQMLK